jgi:sterol desaturase/sphingolipid hydroxylase (fatty acid hydroxylase superfamily)
MENFLRFDWRQALFIYAAIGAIVMIARQVEKKWPAELNQSRADVLMDFKLAIANNIMTWLLTPIAAISSIALVNAAGGGLITLHADTGFHFALSLVVFMLASDLYSYWTHRLSHTVPILWAMHSLHHSAEALTFITGARHLWLETAVTIAFFPLVAVLLRTPSEVVTTALFLGFLPNGCAHLNVRLHLGRFSTWINSPQWHRIHHSIQPEHFDKNFAAVFPIWDVIFGTAWVPGKDKFPKAGLVPSERPGVIAGMIWPFRNSPIAAKAGRLLDPIFRRSDLDPPRTAGSPKSL